VGRAHSSCALNAMKIWISIIFSVLFALAMPQEASGQQVVPGGCGALTASFGPFDYRRDKYQYETTYKSWEALVNIVERAHYTMETQLLVQRKSGLVVSTGADLTYTLSVFPNHHRALLTLVELGQKENAEKPRDSKYTIDCWFKRAVTMAPDDSVVRLIYATYLFKANRSTDAEQQLDVADRIGADKPFTQQNIGLIYFDMKMYDKALLHSHKAEALGFTKQPLKEQLIAAGKWSEPSEKPLVETK
jgi:tetratricopeptide (TPR) repeat protein